MLLCSLYAFAQLTSSPNELWVAFGTGTHYRLIPAHKICAAIGLDKCLALPMFHAFTGCDTDSCFSGRGKRTAWDTWNMYPEPTGQFASLMKKPQLGDVDAAMDTIQRFVVLLYDKTNTGSEVNMVRFEIFARKGRVRQQYSTDEGCASSACDESSIIRLGIAGARQSNHRSSFHGQQDGAGWALMEGSGTLCGVTSQKQAKCAENCCAVVAPKAVAQIASARKPH